MGRTRTMEKGKHQEFGDRVLAAFENAGYGPLSYEKKGAMIGVNGSAFGKIINGHNGAAFDTLEAIAKVTNTNFEWLATGRGKMVYSLTDGFVDISDVPPEKREAFQTVIKELIKTTKP